MVVILLLVVLVPADALWPFSSSSSPQDSPPSPAKSSRCGDHDLEVTSQLSLDPKALVHLAGLGLIEEMQTSGDRCLLRAFADLKITCTTWHQRHHHGNDPPSFLIRVKKQQRVAPLHVSFVFAYAICRR